MGKQKKNKLMSLNTEVRPVGQLIFSAEFSYRGGVIRKSERLSIRYKVLRIFRKRGGITYKEQL